MNQRNNRRIELLAHGSVGKALFALSAPAIAGMMVMAVYNIVDTFFVSLLRDTTAIAATGIVFPVFQLIGAVGLTFGMGAASVISRRLGEHNYEAANEAGATAFYSAFTVGLAFSFVGAVFVEAFKRVPDRSCREHRLLDDSLLGERPVVLQHFVHELRARREIRDVLPVGFRHYPHREAPDA